jgi:hypothetical protein
MTNAVTQTNTNFQADSTDLPTKTPFLFFLPALIFVATSSILFRTYLLMAQPEIKTNFLLLIKGFFGDLFIPFALATLASYFSHSRFTKFAITITALNNLLIHFDFLHFFHYEFRINQALLADKLWLKFIHADRPAFAFILIINAVFFYRMYQLSKKPYKHEYSQKRLSVAVFLCMIIIISQSIPATATFEESKSWEDFLKKKESLCKSIPDYSSYKSLLGIRYEDIFPSKNDLFITSPFFLQFVKQYDELSQEKLEPLKQQPWEKIWSHRGFHAKAEENSVEAVKSALRAGVKGIEIDVHYVQTTGKFVVNHDRLPESELAKKKDLHTFFTELHEDLAKAEFFWLDFKNLDVANLNQSIEELSKVCKEFELENKLFIESPDPFLLRSVSLAGIKTIFAIAYGNNNFFFDPETAAITRAKTVLSKCDLVSIPWKPAMYEDTWQAIGSFPMGLYTVNDEQILKILSFEDSVTAVLTDLEVVPTSLFANEISKEN